MQKLEREFLQVLLLQKTAGSRPADDHGGNVYNMKELETLLKRYSFPTKDMGNKAKRLQTWRAILQSKADPPAFEPWTAEDEAKLKEKQKMDISIKDKALGRH